MALTAFAIYALKSNGSFFRCRISAPFSSIMKLPQAGWVVRPRVRSKASRHMDYDTYIFGEVSNAVAVNAGWLCKWLYLYV